MYPYRVFISYAHDDRELVENMSNLLTDMGLIPIWDRDLPGGKPFSDEIRRRIAQAHLFMPLITLNSQTRPWVHQEIGFAIGIGVPVIPIALGSLPEAMISGMQAILVDEDLSNLRTRLEQTNIESLIVLSDPKGELERLGITTHVAEFSEDRTRLLVRFANETPEPAPVRQQGIFSSFSLPPEQPNSEVWDSIDLPQRRSEYLRTLLREERKILEKHARRGGCSLILYPFLDFSPVGAGVHRTQLSLLRDFLLSMPNDKIRISIIDKEFRGSLTILGDWFGARALPPQPGSEYRQTVFSHHASTVLSWVRSFDEKFDNSLRSQGLKSHETRDVALEWIEGRLRELPKD